MGRDKDQNRRSNGGRDDTTVSDNSYSRDIRGGPTKEKKKKRKIKDLPPPEPSFEEEEESEISEYSEAPSVPEDDDYEGRIIIFYRKYDPDKIKNVPALLKKYRGKEIELLAALELKYGPEPHKLDNPASPTKPAAYNPMTA